MDFADVLAALANKEAPQVNIEPVHINAARRSLSFRRRAVSKTLSRLRVPDTIMKAVLVPEGIAHNEKSTTRTKKRKRQEPEHNLETSELTALLFVALAHRSWGDIESVLKVFGASLATLCLFERVHSTMVDAKIVSGERLCVFCAPCEKSVQSGNFVTGRYARMRHKVLRHLKAEDKNYIALIGSKHVEITEQTTFGDISDGERADIRLNVSRKRASRRTNL